VTGFALQFVQVGRTGVRLPPLASPDSMQPGSGGVREPSRLRVDQITTVPKSKAGTRVGRLEDADILRLNRAVLVFLGLAAPAGARRGS
jgi:mRNA-degrading endonuclease toxin of MazEF toxin-antitoxin module